MSVIIVTEVRSLIIFTFVEILDPDLPRSSSLCGVVLWTRWFAALAAKKKKKKKTLKPHIARTKQQ